MGDSPVNPADQTVPVYTRNCYTFKTFFSLLSQHFLPSNCSNELFHFLFHKSHRCINDPAAAGYFSLCEDSKIIFAQIPCFHNDFLSNIQFIKDICIQFQSCVLALHFTNGGLSMFSDVKA